MSSIARAETSVKADKKRSLAQNKYRWGVVVATVLKYMNEELEREGSEYRATPEDIDFHIKKMALKIAHIIPTSLGDFVIQGKLKTRNKKDFEEAMLQIRCYFDKRGIHIPEPNEVDIEEQYKHNLDL